MNDLYTLLQKIKERPAVYLGQPSINCLHIFLIGYLSARRDLGLDREGTIIDGFQEWIQERAKTNVSQSWAGIILFGSGSERSAFYRFFIELDQFLNRNKILRTQEDASQVKTNGYDERIRELKLYELLERIKKRPGMYLATSSVTRLDILLRGYSLARREVGLAPTEQEREFEGFQKWVQEKYGITSGQSWAKIILFHSIDEQEALEKFFELFAEYLDWNKSVKNCSD